MTLQSKSYPIALLALLSLPACGVNSSDTCAAYRWGVMQGQSTLISPAVADACATALDACPEDVANGDISAVEAARLGALRACLDGDAPEDSCATIAEGVAQTVSQTQIDGSCPAVNDEDSDGIIASADCDDGDPRLTEVAGDNDCDGTLTAADCDDQDASSTVVADDGDCDSLPAESDCDDADPTSTAMADDQDCDGTAMVDDCDDADANSTTSATDADCDTVLTALDCNDSDPDSTTVANDADCDGAATATDCDDTSSTTFPGAPEVCNDGVVNDCTGTVAAAVSECSPMTGDVDLSTADAKFIGEDTSDYAGYSVASAGDVNGDGYADVIVGAPDDDDGGYDAGAAYIILGPVTGDVDLSVADAKFIGEDESDGAGYSVASAGDINGDGYDDVIVGANHAAAYLVFGPATGTIDLSLADAVLIGGGYSGSVQHVASAGDVNGDGFVDLIVETAGDAYMVLGPVAGDVDLSSADAHFSSRYEIISVASAGDVNRDGYDDLIVGEVLESADFGQAHLVLGPVTGDVNLYASASGDSAADATFAPEGLYDHTGCSVASAGDVNGDGYADLLVGAYGDNEGGYYAGAAYLILGPVTGNVDLSAADAKFIGEDSSDLAGYSVASAGDVNGDGYSDILVVAPLYNGGSSVRSGAVYLILGPVTGDVDLSAANARFIGESPVDSGPMSAASAGDVNGDGYADLLVGDSGLNLHAGAAYLILTRSY